MGGLRQWLGVTMAAAGALALLPVVAAGAATSDVEIGDSAFSPDEVTIDAGDLVEWTNREDERHTVTADDSSFDSGELDDGETFRRRFQEAGTYRYHCELNRRMAGVVSVRSPTSTTRGSSTTTSTASPGTTASSITTTTATTTPSPGAPPTTTTPAAPTTTTAPAATIPPDASRGSGQETGTTTVPPPNLAPTRGSSTTTAPESTSTTGAASTTTTAPGPAATTSVVAAVPAPETTGRGHREPNPASGGVENERAFSDADDQAPNRLAVAAFVAVFVSAVLGLAGIGRWLVGRRRGA